LTRFDLAPTFSEEDFRHWFLPQAGIVDSFVVDNGSELTGQLKLKFTLDVNAFALKIHLPKEISISQLSLTPLKNKLFEDSCLHELYTCSICETAY
jgi:hypothetical protein